jgi:hypothetical protein
MPYPAPEFNGFGPNYNFATQGVFSQQDSSQSAPFPPAEGYFLELDGTPFVLLDSTNLDLL